MHLRFLLKEEPVNALSHGIGIGLSLWGLVLLLQRAALFEDAVYLASNAVFGVSFCLLYAASTLLHSARSPKWSERFERLDHAAIFIAIAGTYTPFLLIAWQGRLATELLTAIWLLALGGVLFVRRVIDRFLPWGLLLYLTMGCIMFGVIVPLFHRLPGAGFQMLLYGSLSYLAGVPFFLWRRLRYHHAIWHLFVLSGSICHFIAVYGYVMPALL
ncbi:PAQR family membrane homeostasis protein TrhA [Paenibacillus ferrarius]|uniref:PAQR family membrane homeostasis protein TrhA n=1 Tax=Paenibacillus ferrarius TaxID=1469647 RepID=UPI003D2DF5F3